MPDRAKLQRWCAWMWLAACLLGTQLVHAGHGIEHALQAHDQACVDCLASPGMLAVPVRPAQPLPPVAARLGEAPAILPAPTSARHLSFRSRAPPLIQSR